MSQEQNFGGSTSRKGLFWKVGKDLFFHLLISLSGEMFSSP
jgi:hypothetical protein